MRLLKLTEQSTTELLEIPNKPGYYLDREGNFYSSWVNKGRHGVVNEGKPKKLKGSRSKNGYVMVSFGRKDRRFLHQLMLEVFVGPRPENEVVCHKDDDKTNNRLDNLYWGTVKENLSDRRKNSHMNEGEKHGMSKLSEEQVEYILSAKGLKTQKELSSMFSVHPNTIHYIHKNKTWKHTKGSR